MAKPVKTLANAVAAKARGLENYLRKTESLYAEGHLPARYAEKAYAGAYLEFYGFVEKTIESLFLGLLRDRYESGHASVMPLVDIWSDHVATKVIRGERSYVDWLPYKRYTLRRAKAFFSRAAPFNLLTNDEIRVLDDGAIIRNAIAHQSAHALRRFREKFTNGLPLPPKETRPPGYLRGMHTVGQSRIAHRMAITSNVLHSLCT